MKYTTAIVLFSFMVCNGACKNEEITENYIEEDVSEAGFAGDINDTGDGGTGGMAGEAGAVLGPRAEANVTGGAGGEPESLVGAAGEAGVLECLLPPE